EDAAAPHTGARAGSRRRAHAGPLRAARRPRRAGPAARPVPRLRAAAVNAMASPPRSLTRQLALARLVLGLLQVAICAMLIGAVRSADRANQRTNGILSAVQTISDLEKGVIDSETGMRGFVITGRDEFLEPLNAARAALPDQERTAREQVT